MVKLMEVHKEALVHICLFYVHGKKLKSVRVLQLS